MRQRRSAGKRNSLALLAVLAVVPATMARLVDTPPGPRCTVQRVATPAPLGGTFNVSFFVAADCPAGGLARVRLESGRLYPWRTVRPGEPTTYRGVPWYVRGAWEAASGRVWRFEIPGLYPPFGRMSDGP